MQNLHNHFVRAVALAAKACLPWIGKGDKDAADQAAVEVMRSVLNQAPMYGRIVIGEGERDEAPMLHIGEELGTGGPTIDIAVDPLEGTDLCAHNRPGALCVLSYAPRGDLLHAPDIYMEKLAAGPGVPITEDDLSRPLYEVIARLRDVLGRPPRVLMLDRARHEANMASAKAAGAEMHLIGDGDVMGSLQTVLEPTYDLYAGIGGAPEGVLAASGIQHLGGQFFGRLHASTPEEARRAERLGIDDLNPIFKVSDLAKPSSTLVMAGVTDHILSGVSPTTAEVMTISSNGLTRQEVRAKT